MTGTLGHIAAVARAGFIQLVRSRVYLNLIAAGACLVVAGLAFEELSAGVAGRVLIDVGSAGVALVVAALAGITSITGVTREIESQQIHLLLVRPIPRAEVLVGRFLTTAALVVASNLVLAAVLVALLLAIGAPDVVHPAAGVLFCSFEAFIVAGFALLFGVGSSSTLSAILTIIVFVLGRLTEPLLELLNRGVFRGPLEPVFRAVYWVLPHFERFDLTRLSHGGTADLASVGAAALYGTAYAGALLAFAIARFGRRDLL